MRKPNASIALRPIAARDREAFQAFVRRLSPESRINRFLTPLKELAPGMLQALTQLDPSRHVALIAVDDISIVGEGRFVALDDGGRAEFAIAVADEWQRRGVGTRILDALTAAARCAGLAVLQGEVLRTNVAMLNLMRRAGFSVGSCPGDTALAMVERNLRGA